MSESTMTGAERRAAAILAIVYGVRMLGLFIILPVFSLYSGEYAGATAVLIGLAVGIYGLTQAVFQLPLGNLSDRFGRKPVIIGGLLVFCIGGVIAASAESIYQVIAGRALQGAGAISSTLAALAADLSRAAQRSKMMAVIGIGVAMAFILSLIFAPLLHAAIGMSGLFVLTSVCGAIAIGLVGIGIPYAPRDPARRTRPDSRLAVASAELVRLYVGAFFLHAVVAANFMILPKMLVGRLQLASEQHWLFYLFVLGASFLLMLPMLFLGEKKSLVKQMFLLSLVLIIAGQALWPQSENMAWFVAGATLFFIGFNYLEANLPALVTRLCDERGKGSAMGVFSTAQFIGVFSGAMGAGAVIEYFGADWIALFTLSLLFVWFFYALGMKQVAATKES